MEYKRNKGAYFDYEHLDTYEAGIVLAGDEVKSIKAGRVSLDGSFARIKNGEAWLYNCAISSYPKASTVSRARFNPDRPKKLLLAKKEINTIAGHLTQHGLTLIPLFLYSSNRFVKVKLAISRGKRKFDKREAIKKKEFRRRLNSRVRN